MSTRKAFKRKAAPHETPPPVACDCPHVALESEQLTAAGGGSSSPPDISRICRPITLDYRRRFHEQAARE